MPWERSPPFSRRLPIPRFERSGRLSSISWAATLMRSRCMKSSWQCFPTSLNIWLDTALHSVQPARPMKPLRRIVVSRRSIRSAAKRGGHSPTSKPRSWLTMTLTKWTMRLELLSILSTSSPSISPLVAPGMIEGSMKMPSGTFPKPISSARKPSITIRASWLKRWMTSSADLAETFIRWPQSSTPPVRFRSSWLACPAQGRPCWSKCSTGIHRSKRLVNFPMSVLFRARHSKFTRGEARSGSPT